MWQNVTLEDWRGVVKFVVVNLIFQKSDFSC